MKYLMQMCQMRTGLAANRSARFCGGLGLLAVLLGTSASALAQAPLSGCGPLGNQFGPFDYRAQAPGTGPLKVVEQHHFTPGVESLVGGQTSVRVGEDLDYTLKAFPNHHRALMAMVRLGEKHKSEQPAGASFSVECYFERALRFRPDDSTARMIYATYLAKNQRLADALKQLEVASLAAGENAFTHYNLGLIYFDLKEYTLALAQAHKAYGLGFSQPALKDRLMLIGKWQDEAGPTVP